MTIIHTEHNRGAEHSVLLIHNAGGSLEFLQYQEQYFAHLGYHTVNVDLPAHGQNQKEVIDLSINNIAQQVIDLCISLQMKDIIIIGLNYGACVAIEMYNIAPHLISKLALLAPPILMKSWVVQLVEQKISELLSGSAEAHTDSTIAASFFKTIEQNKQIAKRALSQILPQDLAQLYQQLILWNQSSRDKLQNCLCPILYIQSQTAFCDEQEITTTCPHTQTAKVVGSKYWMTLEVPAQINAMLSRWCEL